MNIKKISFAIASCFNLYSFTFLLIFSGIIGQLNLASDIALIQAAIVAIFMSLSANARNILLADKNNIEEKNLFFFRAMMMLPAALLVYLLVKNTFNISTYLVIGLIVRKCSDWIIELQLAIKEKENCHEFAFKYILTDSIGFFCVLLAIITQLEKETFVYILYLWALIPTIFVLEFFKNNFHIKNFQLNLKSFLPHLGSTSVNGFAMFFFRSLIVILAGKFLAGQMFTAFAIGGVISTLFSFTIGPSIIHQNKNANKILFYIFVLLIFLGFTIILLTNFFPNIMYPNIFTQALGYSIIGGGFMLIAQNLRLSIIQIYKKDVFVADVLINIIIISAIPTSYYLLRDFSFTLLFLMSGLLHLFFYTPLFYKLKLEEGILIKI